MTIFFFIKIALAWGLFAGLLTFIKKAGEMTSVWWPLSTMSIGARIWQIVRVAMNSAVGTFASVTAFGISVCAVILVFFYL